MRAVLGIDAAWTLAQSSGVAVAAEFHDGWHLIAASTSYQRFQALADNCQPAEERPSGSSPDALALLASASMLCGRPVNLVAIDMPLARPWLAALLARPLRSALTSTATLRLTRRGAMILASWAMSCAISERSSRKRCGFDASGGGIPGRARGGTSALRRRRRASPWIYRKKEGAPDVGPPQRGLPTRSRPSSFVDSGGRPRTGR
jgi:hypothetical protein